VNLGLYKITIRGYNTSMFTKREQQLMKYVWEGGTMFRNLRAEQARLDLTDADMGKKLGITREAYIKKKKNGFFTLSEIRILLSMFGTTFEYLFDVEDKE